VQLATPPVPEQSAPPSPARPAVNTIDVRVESVTNLFNSIDPSPFHRKDLDQDAEDFIVSWAREFPRGEPLRLVLHLDEMPTEAECRGVVEAVHNYFAYRADITRRDFRFLMRQGQTSLLIGLLFLAACHVIAEFVPVHEGSTFARIVREGLLIGGWVAMWRPLEIFLYEWWPLRRRRRMFENMSRMDVGFVHASEPRPF
jgi:hypothetical protein